MDWLSGGCWGTAPGEDSLRRNTTGSSGPLIGDQLQSQEYCIFISSYNHHEYSSLIVKLLRMFII